MSEVVRELGKMFFINIYYRIVYTKKGDERGEGSESEGLGRVEVEEVEM